MNLYQGVITKIDNSGYFQFSSTFPSGKTLSLKFNFKDKTVLQVANLILATAEAIISYENEKNWKVIVPSRFEVLAKSVTFKPKYSESGFFAGGIYSSEGILIFDHSPNEIMIWKHKNIFDIDLTSNRYTLKYVENDLYLKRFENNVAKEIVEYHDLDDYLYSGPVNKDLDFIDNYTIRHYGIRGPLTITPLDYLITFSAMRNEDFMGQDRLSKNLIDEEFYRVKSS